MTSELERYFAALHRQLGERAAAEALRLQRRDEAVPSATWEAAARYWAARRVQPGAGEVVDFGAVRQARQGRPGA